MPSPVSNPFDREFIRLVIAGHSYDGIAARTGLTRGAVKIRLYRMRLILRPRMRAALGEIRRDAGLAPSGEAAERSDPASSGVSGLASDRQPRVTSVLNGEEKASAVQRENLYAKWFGIGSLENEIERLDRAIEFMKEALWQIHTLREELPGEGRDLPIARLPESHRARLKSIADRLVAGLATCRMPPNIVSYTRPGFGKIARVK